MSKADPTAALRVRRYRRRLKLAQSRNGSNGSVTAPPSNGDAAALAALTYTVALRNLRSYREHLVPRLSLAQRVELARELTELALALMAPTLGLQPEGSVTYGTIYR